MHKFDYLFQVQISGGRRTAGANDATTSQLTQEWQYKRRERGSNSSGKSPSNAFWNLVDTCLCFCTRIRSEKLEFYQNNCACIFIIYKIDRRTTKELWVGVWSRADTPDSGSTPSFLDAWHQAKKQWVPIFKFLGLNRLGIEPESTVSTTLTFVLSLLLICKSIYQSK